MKEVAVFLGGEGVVADAGESVGGDVGVGGEAVGVGGDSVGKVAHGGVAAVMGDAGGGLFCVSIVDGVEVVGRGDGGVWGRFRGRGVRVRSFGGPIRLGGRMWFGAAYTWVVPSFGHAPVVSFTLQAQEVAMACIVEVG